MMILMKLKKEYWGGVIEFGDIEPGKYTATAEAWNTAEKILEGSGSASVAVTSGETSECNLKMILEGETAYYSKYMVFNDSAGNMYVYDYPTCTKIEAKSKMLGDTYYSLSNFAESNDGSIFYMRLDMAGATYNNKVKIYADEEEYCYYTRFTDFTDAYNLFDAYYDSTTDIYWLACCKLNPDGATTTMCLFNKKGKYGTKNNSDTSISGRTIAVQGANFYYSFGGDSIGYATFDYKTSDSSANEVTTKTLSDFGLSGYIKDIAVLEDGTVAVLVRSAGVDSETECFSGNKWIGDEAVLYSRGALVLLSPDLSKAKKILGWTESSRQIKAVGTNVEPAPVRTVTSKTAYIPEYAKRNSMFYGPVKIVAIRPKELVIADCGANFVLPDYVNKKNGKMYTHNRLMTVNLRNFAIGCKKEFSESELEFMSLAISGGIEASSQGAWENNYVSEK